jgi:hypothetical protein
VLASIVRLLKIASTVICLVVVASFAVFAVNQTKSASGHQQEQLAEVSPDTSAANAAARAHENKGAVHEALDETAGALTSPFSGLVSGSSSEWATRGGKLVAALLVYGFGLGFLARTLRERA